MGSRKSRCPGRTASPVLVDLGVPTLTQFLILRSLSLGLTDFHLYPFTRTQNLALEVETATLLGIVQVEQLLESIHNMLDVGFGTATGGLDIEDLVGLIEGDSGATAEGRTSLLAGVVFSGGLGLLVGFTEGAAEDPGSGDDDLGDNAVRLGEENC